MNIRVRNIMFILVSALLTGLAAIPGAVSASIFNPNLIITDQELQDWDSMGRGEIKSFLKNRGGFIANWITEDVEGKRRRVTDIIFNAARVHKINPKYLLVKLQKEMSLVTDTEPTQRQLDYATGYGVCDSCSFSSPEVIKHQGFGKQVDSAAGIMRWYYDHVGAESYIKQAGKTYTIDSTSVTPQTDATAFLYTYTPHLQGNENFWNLWQQWFDQVYPDGTLLKSRSNPDVYLLQDGKRRKIQSMSVLLSRFDKNGIIEVPDSELVRYDEGSSLNFPNYSILQSGTTYYLVDFDELRPFENYDTVRKLGYNPGEVQQVNQNDIQTYRIGTTITLEDQYPQGRIIHIAANDSLYYIKGGEYSPLRHTSIALKRFPQLSVEKGSPDDLKGLKNTDPLTFPDGTLMGDELTGSVYAIEHGLKRHITDEAVFNGLGYTWDNVLWVDTFTSMIHEIGEPIYLQTGQKTDSPSSTAKDVSSGLSSPDSSEEEGGQGKGVLYFSSKHITSMPVAFPETGKMIATPEDETTYTGADRFTTAMDAYVIADYETGQIVASKNADVVRPIASFTKVMTAHRLFEGGLRESGITTYDPALHKAVYHRYRITAGEGVRNRDLLKVMLVSSRNTPARMLAGSVQKDEAVFIKGMNEQADEWNLEHTYFTDTYGYDLGNQSTAREYLRIFTEGLNHERIAYYMGIDTYEYNEVIDKDGNGYHFDYHTNRLMQRDDVSFEIIASKTGYLYESGYNMAMLARRAGDHKTFVIIAMGNPNYDTKYSEPERLTEWALDTF